MNWKQIFVHGLGSIVLGGLTGGALTGPPHDLAGWRIRTITTAIDVADQYSAVRYWVREWLEL